MPLIDLLFNLGLVVLALSAIVMVLLLAIPPSPKR